MKVDLSLCSQFVVGFIRFIFILCMNLTNQSEMLIFVCIGMHTERTTMKILGAISSVLL